MVELPLARPQNFVLERNDIYVWVNDQARGQDGWILLKVSFCVFMDRDGVEVHKLSKQERGQ